MIDRLHALALRVFGRMPRRVRRMIVRWVAPTFTVGALCRVERADGRVLLIRQSYRQRWGLPGGLLEKGEEASTAAAREVKEEVGLDVVLVGAPAVVVDAKPRRVDIVFNGRPADATACDDARPTSVEIVELGWFAPDEFPELQYETELALSALDELVASDDQPASAANPLRLSGRQG